LNAKGQHDVNRECDELRIGARTGISEDVSIELDELARSAFLRLLIAEAGTDLEPLDRLLEIALTGRGHAGERGRDLRAQGDLTLSVSRAGDSGARRIEITRTLSGDLDADAAATLSATAVGKVDLKIVYLWTDGSHLGTWHVSGAQIAEARAALSEVEDDAVRVAFDVDSVTFEEA
jgi:hypothetical protein